MCGIAAVRAGDGRMTAIVTAVMKMMTMVMRTTMARSAQGAI